MKRFLALIAAIAFVSTSSLHGAKELKLDGVKCPVSGKPVKAESAVAYKGGKAFFCCNGCPSAFKKDTAKFAAKANHQLYVTGQAKLVACAFTGKKLNPATKIEVGGKAVCFCCAGCKGKVLKAEDKIACVFGDKTFAKGFKVGEKK